LLRSVVEQRDNSRQVSNDFVLQDCSKSE
jgi:hypothetical protein